jgi:zinc and cadmium transporter
VPSTTPHEPPEHAASHGHELTWTGAAIGLSLHSLMAGVALAASVEAGRSHEAGGVVWTAGLGTFLAIFLHKPFDSLTLGALMAMGGRSTRSRHLVNIGFGLMVPLGAGLFYAGAGALGGDASGLVCGALAFSAGTFLCISLSDLLPELQFHQHDRLKLSAALLLGLAVAWGSARVEAHYHDDAGHQSAKEPLG